MICLVNTASGVEAAKWRSWIVALVALALAVTFVLGTVGWFEAAFGIGSDCTDEFSCGSGSCAPCARAHAWVTTGGIGQWVLAAAAVTILVLGIRHPRLAPGRNDRCLRTHPGSCYVVRHLDINGSTIVLKGYPVATAHSG